MYKIRERIKGNVYKQITYYGLSDNSNLSSVTDTFVMGKLAWKKLYNNDMIPFLSVNNFVTQKKTTEYFSSESKDLFYYEYDPIKKFLIQKKEFYLYRVKPMSEKGMIEGLGDDISYIVFDFSVGEIYRKSFRIEKVLEGYEEYVPYFKW